MPHILCEHLVQSAANKQLIFRRFENREWTRVDSPSRPFEGSTRVAKPATLTCHDRNLPL
jgi:hypothetical protein